MLPSYTFSLRLPAGLLERIDAEVNQSKEFTNKTDFIIAAIRFYLEHRSKGGGVGGGER